MDYYKIYYVQVNIFSILLLILLAYRTFIRFDENKLSKKLFFLVLIPSLLFCISDLASALTYGTSSDVGIFMSYFFTTIYFLALVFIGQNWLFYSLNEVKGYVKIRKVICAFTGVLSLAYLAFILTNPMHKQIFIIDSNGDYARGPFVSSHYLLVIGYLIISVIFAIVSMVKEDNRVRRLEIFPYIFFPIFTLSISMAQILVSGLTTSQFGIAFGLIILNEGKETARANMDSLTKIDNRRSLERFRKRISDKYNNTKISIMMIDINDFKLFNDKYGHIVGDNVIRDTAEIIKRSVHCLERKSFLCRYGGDEFLIISLGYIDTICFNKFKESIDTMLINLNDVYKLENKITLSIGLTRKICNSDSELDILIKCADDEMYKDKMLQKSQRQIIEG